MIKRILDFCYNSGPIYLSELIDISLDSYNLPLQNETKMGGESSRTSELYRFEQTTVGSSMRISCLARC